MGSITASGEEASGVSAASFGEAAFSARSSWARAAGAALVVGAFLALFYHWFWFQHRLSWGSQDWMHTYVIPLISLYAAWKARDDLARRRLVVFWPALLPIIVGISGYLFFLLGVTNHMAQGISLVLTVFGVVLLHVGPSAIVPLAFPIAYLLFGITIAESLMREVTYSLQDIAASGAWVLLNMVGVTTSLAGNTLTITTGTGESIPLNVAEACSGLRMVIAFFALGAAVAFLSCREWWQRAALLMLVGPIAVLVNVIRVASLGVASMWNEELAKGQAHMWIGVLWLVPAFLLFAGAVGVLNRIVVDERADGGEASS